MELKEFGIYTSKNTVEIIIKINKDEVIVFEYPVCMFHIMSNFEITRQLLTMPHLGCGFIRDEKWEIEHLNDLDFAFLGQIQDKFLIKELQKIIKEKHI